jgi:hypothetical protein
VEHRDGVPVIFAGKHLEQDEVPPCIERDLETAGGTGCGFAVHEEAEVAGRGQVEAEGAGGFGVDARAGECHGVMGFTKGGGEVEIGGV